MDFEIQVLRNMKSCRVVNHSFGSLRIMRQQVSPKCW